MTAYIHKRKKRCGGQSLAELPVMLIMLLFGFTIPLIIMATLGYRAVLLWVSTRAACQAAAKCSTYSSAKSVADTTLSSQIKMNNGISASGQLFIITQPVASSPTSQFTSALGPLSKAADTKTNVYFLRYSVTGTIQPLFPDTAWLGSGTVPGLTGPIQNLQLASENYFENPSGLNQ